MKSSMTSIRVICVHREKVYFKSREVNCLKECALALSWRFDKTTYVHQNVRKTYVSRKKGIQCIKNDVFHYLPLR